MRPSIPIAPIYVPDRPRPNPGIVHVSWPTLTDHLHEEIDNFLIERKDICLCGQEVQGSPKDPHWITSVLGGIQRISSEDNTELYSRSLDFVNESIQSDVIDVIGEIELARMVFEYASELRKKLFSVGMYQNNILMYGFDCIYLDGFLMRHLSMEFRHDLF